MILLCSGGLDSLAAWRLLDCHAVRFDLGTPASSHEREVMGAFGDAHGLSWTTSLTLDLGDELPSGFNPYRNLLLILAAARLDPHVIIAQVAEWAPDKNPRAYRRLQRLMRQAMHGALAGVSTSARIEAPFVSITKAQLITRYHQRFGPEATERLLETAWSCYRDNTLHCGECQGCASRYQAESAYGLRVTRYLQAPESRPAANAPDALRWMRDGSRLGLARRVLETRRMEAS